MTIDNRGVLLKTKLLLPEPLWRRITLTARMFISKVPANIKYKVGLALRKKRYPYSVIGPGDVAVQLGAPADLLADGRSRAAYFAHLVADSGKLVVMEPDPLNCEKLIAFLKNRKLDGKVIVVPKGGWSSDTQLKFYQSKTHPASAVCVDINEALPQQMEDRDYNIITVDVTTIDGVLKEYNLPSPKLVSITTNGAELQILKGMSGLLAENPPEFLSLAIDDSEYSDEMRDIGYKLLANDDRGFTFSLAKS